MVSLLLSLSRSGKNEDDGFFFFFKLSKLTAEAIKILKLLVHQFQEKNYPVHQNNEDSMTYKKGIMKKNDKGWWVL